MDQAASMLGQREHALLIHFDPLRVMSVNMPAGAAIVVADSLEVADKSGIVRNEYNRRVIECAIAARILGKAYRLQNVRVLGDVVKRLNEWNAGELVDTLVRNAPERCSLAQAAKFLNLDEESLRTDILGA